MHTLLIHQAFATPAQGGGTRHYELAQEAMKQGHEFTVVASNLGYLTGKTLSSGNGLVTDETIDGLRVLRAYTVPVLHRSFVWRVVSFLSFMVTAVMAGLRAGPVDVVMGTTPPIFQAVSAWLIAAIRRRPFLLEVRDLWPEFAVGMGVLKNPLLIALARGLERFLYAAATHILVNSPAYRDYLLGMGVPCHKISLIANGVTPEMFDPAGAGTAFRTQWGLDGKFVATYAGALGLANDIPVILDAAELLRENSQIQFVLVGDGKERRDLERRAAKRGLTNVTFTGMQPKSHMADVLAGSDVCIATLQNIPMFTTTYPNKVFDYMASGRPTILGIDGVIRKVVEDAGGGFFVPPGDARHLALGVLALSTDPAAARTMGFAARKHVERHFNRADQAQQFVALLNQLAAYGAASGDLTIASA